MQWQIKDSRDRGGGGGTNPRSKGKKSIIWQNCFSKLHENERNWTKRGHATLAPLGSANANIPLEFFETIRYLVNVNGALGVLLCLL